MKNFELNQLTRPELYATFQSYLKVHFKKKNKIPKKEPLKKLYYGMIVIDDLGIDGISWLKKSEYNNTMFFDSIAFFFPKLSRTLKEYVNDESFQEDDETYENLHAFYELLYNTIIDWLINNVHEFNDIIPDLETIFLRDIAPRTRKNN